MSIFGFLGSGIGSIISSGRDESFGCGSSWSGGIFGGSAGTGISGGSGSVGELFGGSREPGILETLVTDLQEVMEEGAEEFKEIMTDGFYEMVIKGNKNYKTSFEIRDEADKKIAQAEAMYIKKCRELNEYLETFNDHVNKLNEKKLMLLSEMKYKDLCIDPIVAKSVIVNSPEYKYEKTTVEKMAEILGIWDAHSQKHRREAAGEYMEDACDYEVEMEMKSVQIEGTIVFLNEIEKKLDEEEKIIDSILRRKDTREVYEHSAEIVRDLQIMVTQYITDDTQKLNQAYVDAVDRLKRN